MEEGQDNPIESDTRLELPNNSEIKIQSNTTLDKTAKARVRSVIDENRKSNSSIDSNKILNLED